MCALVPIYSRRRSPTHNDQKPNKALDPTAGSVSVLLFIGFMTFLSLLDRAYPAVGQLGR